MKSILEDQFQPHKSLIDTISDGLIIADMDHNIIFANDQLIQMSGYEKELIIGRKTHEILIYKDNVPAIEEKINQTLEGQTAEYELVHKNPKTKKKWVANVSVSPFKDSYGHIIGAIGVIKDISQRKKTESALIESEERYRLIFDNAFDGIVVFDGRLNRPVSCNKRILEYFGCTEVEFLNRSPIELSPEFQPNGLTSKEARKRLIHLYESKQPVQFEWRHKSLDGRLFDTELTTITLPEPRSHIRISIMRDITEQKKAQRQLSASEKRFRSLFEQSPFGVAMNSNLDGKLIVNQRFCEMLGYEFDEFNNKLTLFDVTHPDDRNSHDARYKKMKEGKLKSFNIQKRYLHKKGGVVWGNVTVTAIHEEDGTVSNNFAMIEDITERKFTNNALEFISTQIAGSHSKSFFKKIAKSLANTFDIPFVLIGEIDMTTLEGKSQAFWMNGHFKSFNYSIKNSPCEYAFKSKEIFCLENDVQENYPLFEILKDLDIKSYMTLPLLSSKRAVIGHIALMSDKPLLNVDMVQKVVKIYASRVASELERLQSDNAIKQSAKKLQDAELLAKTGNWEYDLQSRQLYLSKGMRRIFDNTLDPGISIDELIAQYAHPEDLQIVLKAVKNAVKNKKSWDLEVRNIVNGKTIHTISKGKASTKKGKVVKLFGTIQDVSDKKKVESDLSRSIIKYLDLFQNIRDAIVITDQNGKIVDSNQAAQNILGYSGKELSELQIKELVHPDDIEKSKAYIKKLTEEGFYRNYEGRTLTKFGKVKHLLVNSDAIFEKGKMIGSRDIIRDITELKEAEFKKDQLFKKVEMANKELKDFAYIVSHDLKAPLRAIGSLSQWLKEDYKDQLDSQGHEHLDLLINRVNRMHNFIEGILQYSRLGRIQIDAEPVNLNLLIQTAIENVAPPAHVEINVQANLPVIECEKIRILQVFQNLISNSIKFNDKEKGQINISYQELENAHQFSVSDNGVGIEERFFNKIFQIFQTLQVRDHYESTGIGLTVVKRIVEQHGGRITVSSLPGKGSTFEFTLKKG